VPVLISRKVLSSFRAHQLSCRQTQPTGPRCRLTQLLPLVHPARQCKLMSVEAVVGTPTCRHCIRGLDVLADRVVLVEWPKSMRWPSSCMLVVIMPQSFWKGSPVTSISKGGPGGSAAVPKHGSIRHAKHDKVMGRIR
jgi:hypothetical protein